MTSSKATEDSFDARDSDRGQPSPQSVLRGQRAEDRWTTALRRIVQVLGPSWHPCADNPCEGCQAEMAEALRIAKEALGVD